MLLVQTTYPGVLETIQCGNPPRYTLVQQHIDLLSVEITDIATVGGFARNSPRHEIVEHKEVRSISLTITIICLENPQGTRTPSDGVVR